MQREKVAVVSIGSGERTEAPRNKPQKEWEVSPGAGDKGAENQVDKRYRTLSSMFRFFKNVTQVLQTIRIQKSQATGTLSVFPCLLLRKCL